MTIILDQFRRAASPYRPKTHAELLALRLAQKLGEAPSAERYASLLSQYSDGQLLTAYHRAVSAAPDVDRARRFHVELGRTHQNSTHNGKGYKLLAIRVERRAVAAAVFCGDHIEFTQVRQLSSVKTRALASAAGFIQWLTAHLPVESAALEAMDVGQEIHRRAVHATVTKVLQSQTLPIWTVPKRDLLECYGHPPLRGRGELRQVINDLWPVLGGTGAQVFIQDAAALGLHVQTERQFIH
jgi:hypothetical protein